jgi:hypothetical protein
MNVFCYTDVKSSAFLKNLTCEISSSHGGEYEAQNVLGCTAVFLIGSRPALMMEAACTFETSVDIQLRTQQYIPEDSELQVSDILSRVVQYK